MKNINDQKVLNILYKKLDISDENVQQLYFEHLDHLINAIINIRFKEYKSKFLSIDEMDYFLEQAINYIYQKKDEKYLKLITKEIIKKVNDACSFPVNLTFDDIHQYVLDIYHLDSYADIFPKDKVTEMYALISNRIEDGFVSQTKKEIKEELCEELEFTDKKRKTIITSYKLRKVEDYIKNREYDKLNIDKKSLLKMAYEKRKEILNIKEVVRSKININDDVFNYFEERFVQGRLSDGDIIKLLNCSKKISKLILKKYNEILLSLIDNIDIDKISVNKLLYQRRHKVGFDYNNFEIINNTDSLYYVECIVKSLPDYVKEKIVKKPNLYEELCFLIPFLEYFPELNVDKFCKVIKNYPIVREEILKGKAYSETYINDLAYIQMHIEDIISLSLGFSSVNDAEYVLLGKDVYDKNPLRSSKYAEFYLKMLDKKSSYFPIIKDSYQGYSYELSNYDNVNRLLIGVNCEGSCIDLFHNKGCETYEKVLLDKDADVVMINDPFGKFYGRILVFRKGNFVLMGPIRNKKLHHERNEFDKNLVKHIALNILKESMKNDDNIDFVFMADTTFYNNKHQVINDFITLKDERFANLFPHADLNEKVLVLANNENRKYVSFDVLPKEEYFKPRKKINYHPTNDDVMRLLALDKLLKNEVERNIIPFDVNNYKEIVVGESWYLAIKLDGSLEECLLSNADKISVNEFVNMKMKIIEEQNDFLNKPPMV